MATPPAQALFRAVKLHADERGIAEVDAAEQIVQVFRKLDEVWSSYLRQEGLAQLKAAGV